jgi:hypothetical protein
MLLGLSVDDLVTDGNDPVIVILSCLSLMEVSVLYWFDWTQTGVLIMAM